MATLTLFHFITFFKHDYNMIKFYNGKLSLTLFNKNYQKNNIIKALPCSNYGMRQRRRLVYQEVWSFKQSQVPSSPSLTGGHTLTPRSPWLHSHIGRRDFECKSVPPHLKHLKSAMKGKVYHKVRFIIRNCCYEGLKTNIFFWVYELVFHFTVTTTKANMCISIVGNQNC